MASFLKIADGVDVSALREKLVARPELFGQHTLRKQQADSPHKDVTDIWVRYNDINKYPDRGDDLSWFGDEHDSIWYPVIDEIPEVLPTVFGMMSHMIGERLGAVLITKIAPGGKVEKHVDGGWHAGYYEKIYVPIQNEKGAKFCFPDGEIEPEYGEAFWFNNAIPHWVVNDSAVDRIAMVICIKTHRKWR